MRKLEAFEALDGTLFPSPDEALLHESRLMFRDWWDLMDNRPASLDEDDILEWLENNAEALHKITSFFL